HACAARDVDATGARRRHDADRDAAAGRRRARHLRRRHARARRRARHRAALRRPPGPHRSTRAVAVPTGRLSFREFMHDALYGPTGFYASGGRAGRRGDFLTSPEVGPLFGAVVARYLDAEWERLGRPDPFTVVDAGTGPGTLARAVLAADPACGAALRYVAVEVSDAQRESHPHGVVSSATLPDRPIDGVILANELLDNLPFRLMVFDGGWREAFVVRHPDG